MKDIKYFFALVCILLVGNIPTWGADAASLMNSAAAKFAGKSVKVSFSVSGSRSLSGTALCSGKKFAVETSSSSVWYDGNTMYTYNPSTKEVTLTKPSAEELAEANPMTYIAGWKNIYTASMASKQPKTGHCIILTPKNGKSGFGNVVVTLSANLSPQKIVIRTKQKQTYSINIKSFSSASASEASFRFPKSRYKGVKTIDLR